MYDMLLWVFIATYLGVIGILFVRLAVTLACFRVHRRYTSALEPPSVSVCIPARNETHALSQCLERVLASDYPKLEVIVFDDESIDDTSIIIRSFAQAGVRFVPSAPLPEGWLGKNHALDVLAHEANGTFIVFMDVDTFIKPTTISQLVGFMTSEKASMTSVIPRRDDSGRASVFLGTLRYFWQLVSIAKHHVPSSSSLWMVQRHTLLDELGGFEPYKIAVDPETAMAIQLGNAYRGLMGNDELGVSYEKRWRSQVETARRLLYPYFGGTWYSAIASITLLVFLNTPSFIVVSYSFIGWTTTASFAVLILFLFIMLYGFYLYHMWRRYWWLGAFLWPIIILQELVLLVLSIWGYAKKSVIWKGRTIRR